MAEVSTKSKWESLFERLYRNLKRPNAHMIVLQMEDAYAVFIDDERPATSKAGQAATQWQRVAGSGAVTHGTGNRMMRRIKAIVIVIVMLAAALLMTDRVARNVWSRHVFETYYSLKDKHIAPFETAPDHVVVRDDGSALVVFEPPLLFWSAHLSKQSVQRATYAIEISRDHPKERNAYSDVAGTRLMKRGRTE